MKESLPTLWRGLIVVTMCGGVACGDSDGGEAGSGATGGSGGSGATGGSGGSGATGGSGGSGDTYDVAACIAAGETASATTFATRRSEGCKTCVCTACTVEVISACDDSCWNLLECIGTMCNGDGNDAACISDSCSSLFGATGFTEIAACAFAGDANDCRDVCPGDVGGDDAGADDAG